MTTCRHMNLVLIPEEKNKLRCRHCHLVITPEELQGSYCPECYEAYGQKRSDFEEIEAGENEKTRYRCEDCGVIIEA
jgi:Zn finger protein HypA/HybF involved in hydrogenase expression